MALALTLSVGLLRAQQAVVKVHVYSGDVTECVLGEAGAIYFTAQGEQIAVKDEAGVVRGFGLGMVEKVTFDEKAGEPNRIDETATTPLVAYPNPCSDELVVMSDELNIPCVMYDLRGRVVLSSTLHSPLSTLNLKALPSGLYFLRANGQTLKIVKQ